MKAFEKATNSLNQSSKSHLQPSPHRRSATVMALKATENSTEGFAQAGNGSLCRLRLKTQFAEVNQSKPIKTYYISQDDKYVFF